MSRKLTLDINFKEVPRDGDVFGYQISNNGVPLAFNGFDGWDKTFKEALDYTTANAGIMSFNYDLNPNVTDNLAIGNGFNGSVTFIKRQSSGKYICIGDFTVYQGQAIRYICRLNTDFTLDTTFIPPYYSSILFTIEVDSSDRIYIGSNNNVGGKLGLQRLSVNGAIDTTYISGVGFNDVVTCLKLQENGNLLVAGNFTTFNGTTANGLIRLSTTGAKDTSLSGVTTGFVRVSSYIRSMDVQSNGSIVIGGDFVSYNSTTCGNIIILTSVGSIHYIPVALSNYTGVIVGNVVNKVLVDSSDRIYVTGKFQRFNSGTNNCNKIIRLSSSGAYDPTFVVTTYGLQNGSSLFSTGGYDMIINGLGNIVIVGSFTSLQDETVPNIGVLNTVGNISPDGETLSGTLGYYTDIIIRNIIDTGSGYVYVGDFDSYATPNIPPEASQFIIPIPVPLPLDFGTGFDNRTYCSAFDPFNNVYIGGLFDYYQTINTFPSIIKLKSNGDIDPTFGFGSGPEADQDVRVMAFDTVPTIYGQGLYVGGAFTLYNGSSVGFITKITLSDGAIDTSFDTGTGFDGIVSALLIDSGNLYVGGTFADYNGNSIMGIAKLSATGSIDMSFQYSNPSSGFVNRIHDIKKYNNGFLISGFALDYQDSRSYALLLLTSTGQIDPTFIVPTSSDSSNHFKSIVTFDNKIVTVGSFTTYNGVTASAIVRLTGTGTIDTSFVTGTGFNNIVRDIVETEDNGYIVVGDFTSYNGVTASRIIKLTSTGLVDTSFVTGTGFNNSVRSISKINNYYYQFLGLFTTYKSVTQNRIVRLSLIGSVASDDVTTITDMVNTTYDNLIDFNNDYGIVYTKYSDKVRMVYEFDDQEIVINEVYDTPGYVEITYTNESLTLPELVDEIVVRSPYLIVSNTATFSSVNYKVKVFEGSIFSGATQSITYDITKGKLFTGQENIYVNLNNLIREKLEADVTSFINGEYFIADILPTNMSKWVLVNETTFDGSITASQTNYFLYALDGFLYNNEQQGVPNVLITGDKRYIHKDQLQRVYFQSNFLAGIDITTKDGMTSYEATFNTDILGDNRNYIQSLLIDTTNYTESNDWIEYTFTYSNSPTLKQRFYIYDDCKYQLYTIVYKNKWGVLESIPFSRKQTRGIDVKGVDFERSILDYNGNYDITRHTNKQFNVNASESWVLNTNWMPEYMNAAFEELSLSEEIWVVTETNELIPVIKEDTRIDFKTALNDKLIQYTLKVKLSHQVIKNIL